ncbi:pyruvate kinase [Sphingobacteriales bacterium UPWRP_1]|nr:pyruvate kinase [Sphingobacteriales bacterium TSM_CSS]PSJ73370.1 pyruvate kinase [Sphingobacteriales bacterium UPWRP_1]
MPPPKISYLLRQLEKINKAMLNAEQQHKSRVDKVHPSNRKSACNLLHYMALRTLDIRNLQDELHAAGLSSLASSESHIRGQVLAIMRLLHTSEIPAPDNVFTFESGEKSVQTKSAQIFGQRSDGTTPNIMVTFDSEFAHNYAVVKNLLQSGMTVARINCAHDDESTWFQMIQHIRRASKITGLACKIYMDLAGPKIRTQLPGKGKLKIKEGKELVLTDANLPDIFEKNTVGCTIAGIAQQLKPGETVLFDDGLIETRVEKTEGRKALLRIIRISSRKPVIKTEKGINFPDSRLQLPALTEYDRQCLPFILQHADMVGYSFVNSPRDIEELRTAIGNRGNIALILKIETPEAVNNLPSLLLAGLQEEKIGVMIARGDLAVEIGFERMSEIQEEILWICEAAHIPVIWATQVLENLNKSGIATRSEITDAAHAALADCVMVNKGQYIIQVIETLKDIVKRSGRHHAKKRYTFHPLRIASRFMEQ